MVVCVCVCVYVCVCVCVCVCVTEQRLVLRIGGSPEEGIGVSDGSGQWSNNMVVRWLRCGGSLWSIWFGCGHVMVHDRVSG